MSWFKKISAKRLKITSQPALVTLVNRWSLWSGLAVAIISVGCASLGAWDMLEQQSYNLLHRVRRELQGAPAWDDRVVIIAIDADSVAQLGRYPWPRTLYADLLNQLQVAQPAAIAFDILFPEATAQDAQLAEAIAANANVVLAVGSESSGRYLTVTPTLSDPAAGAFRQGDISNNPDPDGISRRLQLQAQGSPSFGRSTLEMYAQTIADTHLAANLATLLPSLTLPIPTAESLWINWPGEVAPALFAPTSGHLPVYTYVDVLEGRVDVSIFQNKIVLIGATLAGIDPMRSPFNPDLSISGVHLHAAVINNLLNRSFLQRSPVWQLLILLLGLTVIGSHLLHRQDVYRRLAMVVCFPIGWGVIAYSGFVMGWWLPVAAPIMTVMLSALAIQIREQQEKQQLMELFSMNVSAGTAELIWQHKGVILQAGELAAQTLTATVLFMDIRGFTGIAETLPSHQLLPWLNQYFETMTDCIMEHGGMVDKYIGDSIMAVFGAPVPRKAPNHIQADAIAALNAAIEMHDRLRSLNHQLSAQQLPTIEFGIGIHTGPLIGGTVGNRHRLNYSLFGDTVNVAARLEALTKTLPASAPFKLLLSADTYHCAQPSFPVCLFKSTQLRGRASNTDIYTISPNIVGSKYWQYEYG